MNKKIYTGENGLRSEVEVIEEVRHGIWKVRTPFSASLAWCEGKELSDEIRLIDRERWFSGANALLRNYKGLIDAMRCGERISNGVLGQLEAQVDAFLARQQEPRTEPLLIEMRPGDVVRANAGGDVIRVEMDAAGNVTATLEDKQP